MYDKAINFYAQRELIPVEDYLLMDDGEGLYFKYWNVVGTPEPSLEELNNIINNISFAVEFEDIKTNVTELQKLKQKDRMLLASKFVLDCSDDTANLIIQAQTALLGSGRTSTRLIDYEGVPNDITLDDIDIILGNADKGILGEIPTRRLDLHEQEISILEKVLLGEPYELQFV